MISILQSTILNQDVHSQSVKLAIEGKNGSILTQNYLNKNVISSYSPLTLDGLNWVIIAEQEIEEAEEPIKELQNNLLVSSTILATLITFYSIWLAYTFLQPITTMTKGVKRVILRESKSKIKLHRGDEFGELSNNINSMINIINEQEKELEKMQKQEKDFY